MAINDAKPARTIVGVVRLALLARVNHALARILLIQGINALDANKAARPIHQLPVGTTREMEYDVVTQ